MATVVDFEVPITAENQSVDGQGQHIVLQGACPDLFAATRPGVGGARVLPVGWKLKFLVDSNTGEEKGVQASSPDGRSWILDNCSSVRVEQKGMGWTWLGVIGLGVIFYYVYAKKGK